MTFEEIQKTIEGMLAVQRNLQDGQLKLQESQTELQGSLLIQKEVLEELIQKYGDLGENSIRQQHILDQLLGYSFSNETDHLNLEQKLQSLESRVRNLEQ